MYARTNNCGSHDTDSLIWGNDDEYSEALSVARLQKGTRECYSDINVLKRCRNEKFSMSNEEEEHLGEVCVRNEQESEENLMSDQILKTPRFVFSLVSGIGSKVNVGDMEESYEKSSVSTTGNYELTCNINGDEKSNSREGEQVVGDNPEILENSKKISQFTCEDLTTVREDGEIIEGIKEASNREIENMNVPISNTLKSTYPYDVDNKIPTLNTSIFALFKNSPLEQDSQTGDEHGHAIVDFKDVLIKNIELIKSKKILKDINQDNTILRSFNYQDGSINVHETLNMLDNKSFISRSTLSTIEELQTLPSKSNNVSKTYVDEGIVEKMSLFDPLDMERGNELKERETLERFDDNEDHVTDFDLRNANNNDTHPEVALDIAPHLEPHNSNTDVTVGKEVETPSSKFDGCRCDEKCHIIASIMRDGLEEELTNFSVEQISNSRCFLTVKFEDDLTRRKQTQSEILLKQFRSDKKLQDNFGERIINPRNSLLVMWKKHPIVSLENCSRIFSNDYFDASLDECANSSFKQCCDTILENNCQSSLKTQVETTAGKYPKVFVVGKKNQFEINSKRGHFVRFSKQYSEICGKQDKTSSKKQPHYVDDKKQRSDQFQLPKLKMRNTNIKLEDVVRKSYVEDLGNQQKSVDLPIQKLSTRDHDNNEKLLMEQSRNIYEEEFIGQFKLPNLRVRSANGKQILPVNHRRASKVLELDNDSKNLESDVSNDSKKPVQIYSTRDNAEFSSSVASSHNIENEMSCTQTEVAKSRFLFVKKSNSSDTYKIDLRKQMKLKILNEKMYKTEISPPINKCDDNIFSSPLIPNVALCTEITKEDMTNDSVDDSGQPLAFQEMRCRSVKCSENLYKNIYSEVHVIGKGLKNHDDSGKKLPYTVFNDDDERCYQKVSIQRPKTVQLEKPVHLNKYSTNQAQENITNEKIIIRKWPANKKCREDEEETDLEINCSPQNKIFVKKPVIRHLEKQPNPRTDDVTKSQASR